MVRTMPPYEIVKKTSEVPDEEIERALRCKRDHENRAR